MDDGALAKWLALREPNDAAARSETVTRRVVDALSSHDPVRVVDLATGNGSNIRYLLGRFPGRRQHWLAVDRSATLLSELPVRMSAWAAGRGYAVDREGDGCVIRGNAVDCHVETRQLDLGTFPRAGVLGTPQLVTASALLDLVSEQWLRAAAAWCRDVRAAALFAVTYNGSSSSSPVEPEDEWILNLFNQHQRTDKGLGGTAAGPDAGVAVERCFAEVGYDVLRQSSDWHLGVEQAALQRELIAGWAAAVAEIAPDRAAKIQAWRDRRLRHVEAGRSRLAVGHDDVGAWLK
jgi:hypothetical protein